MAASALQCVLTGSARAHVLGFYDDARAAGLGLHVAPGGVVATVAAAHRQSGVCRLVGRRALGCLAARDALGTPGDWHRQTLLTPAARHVGARRRFYVITLQLFAPTCKRHNCI